MELHFVLLWLKSIFKVDWNGCKLTPDPGESRTDALTEERKNTPEPGGVWEPRAEGPDSGLIFPNTDSQDGSSPLSFPCLSYLPISRQVSLYPKPTWWAHVPEGPSAQKSFTFSATHIVCPEMNRQGILAGEGVILPEGEKEVVVGYFRISWGFVGIPFSFVISSSWELGDIRGESWAAGGVG